MKYNNNINGQLQVEQRQFQENKSLPEIIVFDTHSEKILQNLMVLY